MQPGLLFTLVSVLVVNNAGQDICFSLAEQTKKQLTSFEQYLIEEKQKQQQYCEFYKSFNNKDNKYQSDKKFCRNRIQQPMKRAK